MKDFKQHEVIEEVLKVKKLTVTIVAFIFLIATLLSIYYNLFLMPRDSKSFIYLGIFQMFLCLLSISSLIHIYMIKNLNTASILLILTTFGASVSVAIAAEGQYHSYIFMPFLGLMAFTLLKTRLAGVLYFVSSLIILILSSLFHDAEPATIYNFILVSALTGGVLFAFSTINHKALRELGNISRTDALTGLWNKKMFNDVYRDAFLLSQRHGWTFVVILGDIDHFKSVNDTFGHDVGDKILKAMAKVLSDLTRETDMLARWGGEEFVLLLPNTAIDGAEVLVKKIITELSNRNHEVVGSVTMSFGLSECIQGDKPEDVFKRADTALYMAKDAGRNCYKVQ